MDEKLFSITCVTCQARLAVRSLAAIGTILECPKCQSLVHVTPPPGWSPPGAVTQAAAGSAVVPPPLDRVATDAQTLELEPTEAAGGSSLVTWLAAAVAALVVMIALVTLPRLMSSSAEPEQAAAEASPRDAATTVAEQKPKVSTTSTAVAVPQPSREPPKPPTTEIATNREASATPTATPPASTSTAATSGALPETTSAIASTSSQAVQTPDAKPATDPLAGVAQTAEAAAAEVEIKKAPPQRIDVTARLSQAVPQIQLSDMPLVKVIELLSVIGGAPITVDVDAAAQLGVDLRSPISLDTNGKTVAESLQAAAAQMGLAAVIDTNQAVVTAPAEYRESLKNVRYTVTDLLDGEKPSGDELANLVRKLVAPSSWQEAGGRGTIAAQNGALVVVQTPEVHQQVLVFCEKLRNARHRPLRSRENPERFALTTRRSQAKKLLNQAITVNFHDAAPLAKVLAYLASTTSTDIVVDHAALAAAETCDRVEATVTAQKKPLGQVLSELLQPLGLGYRACGPSLIQVTTKEAVEERLELEFYPVAGLLSETLTGPVLSDRLKGRVMPTSWSDVGGLGEIFFDPPSQCLIVLQSQPAQAAIEGLLSAAKKTGRSN